MKDVEWYSHRGWRALDERQDVGILSEHAAQVRELLLQQGVRLLDVVGGDLALELKAHGHSHEGADLLPETERPLDGLVGSHHCCYCLMRCQRNS